MANKQHTDGVLEERIARQDTSNITPITLQGARVLPNATDVEEYVLGALLLEPYLVGDLNEYLKPEHFYDRRNAQIFQVMQKVYLRNLPVDNVTVTQALREEGILNEIGGVKRIGELSMLVASGASAQGHVRILIQKYMQRELIRLSGQMQVEAYSPDKDVEDLLQEAEDMLYKLHEYKLQRDVQSLEMALATAFTELEARTKDPEAYRGVPTGFQKLDMMTQGWQKGDLIIVAARPSMGKTAFALTMARDMAVRNAKRVVFFSLEMYTIQLVYRLLSAESGINSKQLRAGNFSNSDWQRLLAAFATLSHASIYIDDSEGMTLNSIRTKCRRLKMQENGGIDIVMIDYLQLINSESIQNKNSNREQEVSRISRGLKALAKELNVPIIALAQLSRAVDARSDKFKRPLLSDLRESGSIEQDADIVAFINRPEKNNINEFADGSRTKGIAEIIIAKHRNGEVGSLFVTFDSNNARFVDTGDMIDHNNPDNPTYNDMSEPSSTEVVNYPSSSNSDDLDSYFTEEETPF